MCKDFWWGQSSTEAKLPLISWASLCKPKEEGGLGFRKFKYFNLGLLAKQGWRLIHHPESLAAQILKAKYFPRGSFWEAKIGHQPSFLWSSILHGREVLREGSYWRIGDGNQVSIWQDRWLPMSSNHMVRSPPQGLARETKVQALIDHNRRCWNVQLVRQCFNSAQAEEILNIPLSQNEIEDKLIWGSTRSGVFTVRTATMIARRLDARTQPFNEASLFW